jgi:hypothetical protein
MKTPKKISEELQELRSKLEELRWAYNIKKKISEPPDFNNEILWGNAQIKYSGYSFGDMESDDKPVLTNFQHKIMLKEGIRYLSKKINKKKKELKSVTILIQKALD